MRHTPHRYYQWSCLIFSAVLLLSAWSAYKNLRANLDKTIVLSAKHLVGLNNISLTAAKKGTLPTIRFDHDSGYAALTLLFPVPVKTGVLEVEIDPSAELYRNDISLRVTSSAGGNKKTLNLKSNKWLPLRPDNHIYRIPLYRDHVKSSVVLDLKYAGALPGIPIKSITLKPASFYDFPIGGLIIGLFVIAAMFLPGLIIASCNPKLNILPLSLTAFIFSLPIHLVGLFAVIFFARDILYLPVISCTIGLFFLIFRSRQYTWKESIRLVCKNATPDFNVWILSMVIICTVLSYLYPSAVYNIHQGHLSRQHTFKAFTAHDSVFQFANAKSVLEGNFEKYYGNESYKKLLFLPQDREILPGLVYASIILFLKPFLGNELAQQFFPFVVYFLLCHALLLYMFFTWIRSYDLKLAYATTFFLATTPVFWVLAMIGWFKYTGAAFMLAGIYIIKEQPTKFTRWVLAGALFGLAKNYHAGNTLALPIITLWLLFLTYRNSINLSLKKLGLLFLSITATACLTIFPWNLFLKHVWHVGSHRLFSIHFLNNHYIEKSLWLSIVQFFNDVPLAEQLGIRIERTIQMFNVNELINRFAVYEANNIDTISAWLKFSSSFLVPSIFFALLLSILIVTVGRKTVPTESRKPYQSDLWLDQFGWICLINFIVLAFASYGGVRDNVGITWHYPPLLIVGMLSSLICWSCRFHRDYSSVWIYAGFFQLGLLVAYG